ncbi:MAG: hypothetical protein F4X47_12055, partial [Gammaproteobacteria bacterium]|nr:hypothetical protein [Gammaproteobacteria bacterium]
RGGPPHPHPRPPPGAPPPWPPPPPPCYPGLPPRWGGGGGGAPDGPTHHGAFDIAYMLLVPGMTVTAPKDGDELIALMKTGLTHDAGPYSIRYPRDAVPAAVPPTAEIDAVPYGSWEVVREGSDMAILAVGTMVLEALSAADELAAAGIDATVVNCRFLKPFDEEVLERVLGSHERILTVEEGTVVNGFGALMAREIQARVGSRPTVRTMGLPDVFIEHGDRGLLLAEVGLDAEGIAREALRLAGRGPDIRVMATRESA